MTFDEVRAIGLTLPQVTDGTSYGTPALKVKGKLLVRLRDDIDAIVLPMPFDRRDELIAENPDTYFITDHYAPYEYVLAHLARLNAAQVRDLLGVAYRLVTKPRNVIA